MKIEKNAEFLTTLREMVNKEPAEKVAAVNKAAEKPEATGKPGADTHPAKTSPATEHVNKNEQGHPENNPQEFKQEKAKDAPLHGGKTAEELEAEKLANEAPKAPHLPNTGAPTGVVANPKDAKNEVTQKKAEEAPVENTELAKMGAQLLEVIHKLAQQEKAAEKPEASGVPGADTHPTKTSPATEHVNKNEQGHPEHNPQEFKQEKAKDVPLHGGKTAEEQAELDKQASFELGRQFCREFLQTKVAATNDVIYKEAGRRDFECLISQAAAELEQEEAQKAPRQQKQASAIVDEAVMAEKQAEEAGAQAFYAMMKQAQDEYQAEQIKQAFEQRVQAIAQEKVAAEKRAAELEAKLHEKEAALQKKAEEDKRAEEFSAWSNVIVNRVVERLQSEASR